jgi:hypothetical protein
MSSSTDDHGEEMEQQIRGDAWLGISISLYVHRVAQHLLAVSSRLTCITDNDDRCSTTTSKSTRNTASTPRVSRLPLFLIYPGTHISAFLDIIPHAHDPSFQSNWKGLHYLAICTYDHHHLCSGSGADIVIFQSTGIANAAQTGKKTKPYLTRRSSNSLYSSSKRHTIPYSSRKCQRAWMH